MKAYELIEKPENWTRGISYRDAAGQPCTPDAASSYCALGAIYASTKDLNEAGLKARKLNAYIFQKTGNSHISFWNDNPRTTHQEVYETLRNLDL